MLLVVAAVAVLWLIAGVIVLRSTSRPTEIADMVLADETPVTAPVVAPVTPTTLVA